MKAVFADTSYWIASLSPNDDLHGIALEVSKRLGSVRIYTSDSVLVELMNFFGERGAASRQLAHQMVIEIMGDNNITVISQTRDLFLRGVELYAKRRDKGYSLTDCISMEIMTEHGISECLTGDHHFEQAGFVRLLK